MTEQERTAYNTNRQNIISKKRSLRMQGKPYQDIKTPEKLAPLMGYELTDTEGDYAGFTLDYEEATEAKGRHGYNIKKRPANKG